MFVVVLLVVFALALPMVAFRVHRLKISGSGVHRVLCQAYREEFWYWEGVYVRVRGVCV